MPDMQFKLWLEVKYTSDTLKQIQDSIAKDKFVTLWLDMQGNIRIGWPEREESSLAQFYRSIDNRTSVSPESKRIVFKMIGDKVKPAHKKIIKFLLDNNIIDNSWTVQGGSEIGEYIGHTYSHFSDPDLPRTVADVQKAGILTPAIKDITLYHGTTSYGWEKIKKAGALYPLFVGTNKTYGPESRAKHKYNKDFLYLATNPDKAWDYAKTMAGAFNRKYHKKEWDYVQHSGAERWTIKPVLLQVKVPDITKLRADDDVANARMRDIAEKLWKQKTPEDQKRIMGELSRKQGFEIKDPSIGRMLWRDTDEGFEQILARINPKIYNAWMASMLRTDQVAYKGFIPLKYIKEIPIFNK